MIADQTIALDGTRSRQDYPVHLRRIRFRDPETGKTLVFLTNQTTLPASTICDLYKSRWKVELSSSGSNSTCGSSGSMARRKTR